MKFYDCVTAPSPRRVRIFLAEKARSILIARFQYLNSTAVRRLPTSLQYAATSKSFTPILP